jgi:hypothetical protein
MRLVIVAVLALVLFNGSPLAQTPQTPDQTPPTPDQSAPKSIVRDILEELRQQLEKNGQSCADAAAHCVAQTPNICSGENPPPRCRGT